MENAAQESNPTPPPIDPRIAAVCRHVANGLTIRVAIKTVYEGTGNKHVYYKSVSEADRQFIRRLSQENDHRAKTGGEPTAVVRCSLPLPVERHAAVCRRVDQLSVERGRLVTLVEYMNNLIAADLRLTDAASLATSGATDR